MRERRKSTLWISPQEHQVIEGLATRETNGDFMETVFDLLSEAIASRHPDRSDAEAALARLDDPDLIPDKLGEVWGELIREALRARRSRSN